jgi:hypothetical protein
VRVQEAGDQSRVRRGDPGVGQIRRRRISTRTGGKAERRRAEREVEHLFDVGAGVDVEIAAGDAEIQVTGGDVDGDVAWAQVEELDVVVGIEAGEVLVISALAVSRLAQHLDGGGAEAAFVGYGDTQHFRLLCGRFSNPDGGAVTDVGTRL